MQFQKLLVLALLLILIGNASAVDITKCIAINSPGTYVLQNNLTTSDNDCITINSNNVTLDGKGYTIAKTGDPTNNGVYAFNRTNITIKDLKIIKFQHGIYLQNTIDSTIENNTITSAGNGTYDSDKYGNGIILISGSNNNTIKENTITNSIGHGIAIYSESHENSISENTINQNNYSGIFVDNSNGTTIKLNEVNQNGRDGIKLTSINDAAITSVIENTINENNEYGIRIFSSTWLIEIFDNTIHENKNGISVFDGIAQMENNNVCYNQHRDISCQASNIISTGLNSFDVIRRCNSNNLTGNATFCNGTPMDDGYLDYCEAHRLQSCEIGISDCSEINKSNGTGNCDSGLCCAVTNELFPNGIAIKPIDSDDHLDLDADGIPEVEVQIDIEFGTVPIYDAMAMSEADGEARFYPYLKSATYDMDILASKTGYVTATKSKVEVGNWIGPRETIFMTKSTPFLFILTVKDSDTGKGILDATANIIITKNATGETIFEDEQPTLADGTRTFSTTALEINKAYTANYSAGKTGYETNARYITFLSNAGKEIFETLLLDPSPPTDDCEEQGGTCETECTKGRTEDEDLDCSLPADRCCVTQLTPSNDYVKISIETNKENYQQGQTTPDFITPTVTITKLQDFVTEATFKVLLDGETYYSNAITFSETTPETTITLPAIDPITLNATTHKLKATATVTLPSALTEETTWNNMDLVYFTVANKSGNTATPEIPFALIVFVAISAIMIISNKKNN